MNEELKNYDELIKRHLPEIIRGEQALPFAADALARVIPFVMERPSCCPENRPRSTIARLQELCRICHPGAAEWNDAYHDIPLGCMSEDGETLADPLVGHGALRFAHRVGREIRDLGESSWLTTPRSLDSHLGQGLVILVRELTCAEVEMRSEEFGLPVLSGYCKPGQNNSLYQAAAKHVLPEYVALLKEHLPA